MEQRIETENVKIFSECDNTCHGNIEDKSVLFFDLWKSVKIDTEKRNKGDEHFSEDGIITNRSQVFEPETTENFAHRNINIISFSIRSTSKINGRDNIDPLIPLPFKRGLFWPQQDTTSTLKRKYIKLQHQKSGRSIKGRRERKRNVYRK